MVAVLGLPAPASSDQALPLDDESLGEFAVLTTMAVLTGEGHDAAVAGALVQLADELGVGTRHERLVFIADMDSTPRREAPLDIAARDRLRQASGAARVENERPLPGILVEADFERFAARLRTPTGEGIAVTFTSEQADDIQQALRQQTEVEGRATYDAASDRLVSLELRRLVTAPQLPLYEESQEFWSHPSVEELARRRPAGRRRAGPCQPSEAGARELSCCCQRARALRIVSHSPSTCSSVNGGRARTCARIAARCCSDSTPGLDLRPRSGLRSGQPGRPGRHDAQGSSAPPVGAPRRSHPTTPCGSPPCTACGGRPRPRARGYVRCARQPSWFIRGHRAGGLAQLGEELLGASHTDAGRGGGGRAGDPVGFALGSGLCEQFPDLIAGAAHTDHR